MSPVAGTVLSYGHTLPSLVLAFFSKSKFFALSCCALLQVLLPLELFKSVNHIYVDIFCRIPPEGTWVSTTPEGFSIPTPNQTGWEMGMALFCRGLCVDLDLHNTCGHLSP